MRNVVFVAYIFSKEKSLRGVRRTRRVRVKGPEPSLSKNNNLSRVGASFEGDAGRKVQ